MENEILRKFYQRTLPLYRPQAEKFLQTAQPQDFNEVSFRYTFSVEALIHISNIIEDFVLANKDVAYQIIAILHQLYPQTVPRPLMPDLLSEY